MNYQTSSSQNSFHSLITHEQLEQVIEAISDGRYSWACVLILRFIGYNPLHFIPQRTYSRLMKEHKQFTATKTNSNNQQPAAINSSDSQETSTNFNTSSYLNSNLATLYPLKEKVLQN